jgi:hypothetical protein
MQSFAHLRPASALFPLVDIYISASIACRRFAGIICDLVWDDRQDDRRRFCHHFFAISFAMIVRTIALFGLSVLLSPHV